MRGGSSGLTQLVSGERQTGGVLVQVLVEVDAEVAQLLLDGFDLLMQEQKVDLVKRCSVESAA